MLSQTIKFLSSLKCFAPVFWCHFEYNIVLYYFTNLWPFNFGTPGNDFDAYVNVLLLRLVSKQKYGLAIFIFSTSEEK